MPSIVRPSVEILIVPRIRSSVSKISKPRKMKVKIVKEKTVKSVKSGGHYVGSGSSKYWRSDTKGRLKKTNLYLGFWPKLGGGGGGSGGPKGPILLTGFFQKLVN
jgi:hypothetical protein